MFTTKGRLLTAVLTSCVLAGTAATGAAQAVAPTEKVASPLLAAAPPGADVEVMSTNGSGCSSDSASLTSSSTADVFGLTLEENMQKVGGSNGREERANCQVAVQVTAPKGYSYAIAGTRWYGQHGLAPGAVATFGTTYYTQGESKPILAVKAVRNEPYPTVGFNRQDFISADKMKWSPCNKTPKLMNIHTDLRLTVGTDEKLESIATWGQAGSDEDLLVTLNWKKC